MGDDNSNLQKNTFAQPEVKKGSIKPAYVLGAFDDPEIIGEVINTGVQNIAEAGNIAKDTFFKDFLGIGEAKPGTYAESSSLIESRFIESAPITGFDKPRGPGDVFPEFNVKIITESLREQSKKTAMATSLQAQMQRVNEFNGFDPTYTGTVNQATGEVNIHHENNAIIKEAETIAMQAWQKRDADMKAKKPARATSPKGAVGPQVTMNLLDQENANQVSKLQG